MSTLEELIILNTDARMEICDEDCSYVPRGAPIEVGMLNFLICNGVPVQDRLVGRERRYELCTMIPFSPYRRRSVVAYRTDEQTVRVVVKGAPEDVVPMCTYKLDGDCDPQDFSNDEFNHYLQEVSDVIINESTYAFKPITYAYKDMSL